MSKIIRQGDIAPIVNNIFEKSREILKKQGFSEKDMRGSVLEIGDSGIELSFNALIAFDEDTSLIIDEPTNNYVVYKDKEKACSFSVKENDEKRILNHISPAKMKGLLSELRDYSNTFDNILDMSINSNDNLKVENTEKKKPQESKTRKMRY